MPWRPVAAGTGHAWVSSRSKEGAPKVILSNNLDLNPGVNQNHEQTVQIPCVHGIIGDIFAWLRAKRQAS